MTEPRTPGADVAAGRAGRGVDLFFVFVLAIAACTALIEIADPALMEVKASTAAAL